MKLIHKSSQFLSTTYIFLPNKMKKLDRFKKGVTQIFHLFLWSCAMNNFPEIIINNSSSSLKVKTNK